MTTKLISLFLLILISTSFGVNALSQRTQRPDIMRGLKTYHGGLDFSNPHYWSSVGSTGAAGFIMAVLWIICFGLLVVFPCSGKKKMKKYLSSKHAPQIRGILLILFSFSLVTGCLLLSVAQYEFHEEMFNMIKYVIIQSDHVIDTLRDVNGYLTLAKNLSVAQFLFSSNVQNEISILNGDLDSTANTLEEKTSNNTRKMRGVFKYGKSVLIVVAVLMILIDLLGLVLFTLGHRRAIRVFIFIGWLLVAITFVLCGVSLAVNNALVDTHTSMEEWVNYPHMETALSDILSCIDQSTANKTLVESKEVINMVVKVVNMAINVAANVNLSQSVFYQNQSGPLVPLLCSPLDSQLNERPCGTREVALANASQVWKSYTCISSADHLCTSVGRITQEEYEQLVLAVNVSYALYHYGPSLLALQDCSFVQAAFRVITSDYCPELEHHLKMMIAGLWLASLGLAFCLIIWVQSANHQQEEDALQQRETQLGTVMKHSWRRGPIGRV